MRRSLYFISAFVIIPVLLIVVSGFSLPLVQAQGAPTATSAYVSTSLADMMVDAKSGGGQAVSFSGKILVHFEDTNEFILGVTEKGNEAGVVLVYLSAPIVSSADETTAITINGIVGSTTTDVFLAGSTPNKLTMLTIRQAYISDGIAQVLPTATMTTPEQRTATAQVQQNASTSTKQARLDAQTSTAAAYQATQMAYYDNVTASANARHSTSTQAAYDYSVTLAARYDNMTSTANAWHSTLTQQASDYHDTATAYAQNYVPPAQSSGSSGGSSGGSSNGGGNVAPTSAPAAAGPSHPPGTTGQCKDGTYTSAVNHQGACSHHGGVAQWF